MAESSRKDDLENVTFTDRIPIRARMLLVGLAVTAAMAVAGTISYDAQRRTAERGFFLYDSVLHSLSYARAAQKEWVRLRDLVLVFHLTEAMAPEGGSQSGLSADDFASETHDGRSVPDTIRFLLAEARANLKVSERGNLPARVSSRPEELIARVDAFQPRLAALTEQPLAGDFEALAADMREFEKDLELFVQDVAAEGFRVREEMGRFVEWSRTAITVAIVIAILIAVLTSFLFGELVLRKLREVSNFAQRVADGELGRKLDVVGRTELTMVMRGLESMRQSIRSKMDQIEGLRREADHLVDVMLPQSIAERLRVGEERIADARAEATIVFIDLAGFTELTRRFGAAHLIETLDGIFRSLDEATERHGIEKIKTIGDAYMAAAGVTSETRPDDAARCAAFALEARDIVRGIGGRLGYDLDVRIGIHNGAVVAGILGKSKLFFDIWGDAVNLAARLEASALNGEIRVSETAYWRLHNRFALKSLGAIELKGIGPTPVFLLEGKGQTT